MDDTFRLDLADCDKEYTQNVLDTFLEKAADHRRKLIEIRMSQAMADRLGIEDRRAAGSFRGVPVAVCDTGFEGAIEVILGPIH